MRSGSGRRTRSKMRRISARRCSAGQSVWVESNSSTWSPQVMTGLSAVMGSWNTMPMLRPRKARKRAAEAPSKDSPCNSMSPPLAWSSLASKPITVVAMTDLPEPDSPTTHRVWPGRMLSDTRCTACTRSLPEGKDTDKSRMDNTGTGSALITHPSWQIWGRARRANHRPTNSPPAPWAPKTKRGTAHCPGTG